MKKKPDWIFFSITMESFVKNLAIDVKLLKEENPNVKIAIGGQGIKNIDGNEFKEVDIIIKEPSDLQNLFYII